MSAIPTLETPDLPEPTEHEKELILRSWWAVNVVKDAAWLGSRPELDDDFPAITAEEFAAFLMRPRGGVGLVAAV